MTTEPEINPVSATETQSTTLSIPASAPAVQELGAGMGAGVVGEIRGWARDVFFAIGTAILIVVFLYQPVKVEGTSMLPELVDQERIFVNKFVYRIEKIHRKDIVVFWYPLDPTKSYINRVIGMPGDVVDVRRGIVYVNDSLWKRITSCLSSWIIVRTRPYMSSPDTITSLVTIETNRTTAECGALSRRNTSTAKPSSDTG